MSKYIYIGGGVLLLLILIFLLTKGKSSGGGDQTAPKCANSFVITSGSGLVTTIYSFTDGKYYKEVKAGIAGYQGQLPPKEITKADFEAACKKSQIPPTATT